MSERIEDRLKAKAREMGFELAGIARAAEADGFPRFRDWLDRGYAGEMDYLHRQADPRRHPESILEDVRSLLMLGITYADCPPLPASGRGAGGEGSRPERPQRVSSSPLSASERGAGGVRSAAARVAKYALGPDYHRFLWDRLNDLGIWLDAEVPGTRSRGIADSAPLLERDFARRAGLGWVGKNTMLLNKQHGSFFLLCALLTTPASPDPRIRRP